MKYTFATGDRPLDGYTIQKGLGRGGFGEVYLAQSDGGKQVALKLVQRNLEVELRGVGQCLNLKHANLALIYDVKTAENGDHWVVMEYLAGETLDQAIARYPDGVPEVEALSWLRGICDGVGYLHDQGIVHRDLKPSNIFLENGVIKIGDCGLSKFITTSKRSGQTGSVGTVHYMAPEVANGRYGKEVDIYAIGVIFYEMLMGRVPFDGETPGEILMKHLTAWPDLNLLSPRYRGVIARLLEKDPARRYSSVPTILADIEAHRAMTESLASSMADFASASGAERAYSPQFTPPPLPKSGKRLCVAPEEDHVVSGVCAGFANYFGIDPTWVRLFVIVLMFCTAFAPVIVAYFILSGIMPEAEKAKEIPPPPQPSWWERAVLPLLPKLGASLVKLIIAGAFGVGLGLVAFSLVDHAWFGPDSMFKKLYGDWESGVVRDRELVRAYRDYEEYAIATGVGSGLAFGGLALATMFGAFTRRRNSVPPGMLIRLGTSIVSIIVAGTIGVGAGLIMYGLGGGLGFVRGDAAIFLGIGSGCLLIAGLLYAQFFRRDTLSYVFNSQAPVTQTWNPTV